MRTPLHVFDGRIHQQIYVLGCADETVKNDRESADEYVADALGVQRFAERDEVFELRRA